MVIIMKNELVINIEDRERLADIGKALSSPMRLDILYYLSMKPAIISDVAAHFEIPLSSAALHIKTLESAGLISVQPIPGSKGAQKLCGVLISRIDIDMFRNITENSKQLLFREDLPIGSYFDCDVCPPCGIVSEYNDLGAEDSLSGFYSPDRFKAQLIWLSQGYLEYRFSNATLKLSSANKIQITFEICSEALGYNNNWRSDVSIWFNDTEVGLVECLGDYGGRRGKLNPYWWSDASTQYGDLRKIWVTDKGCFIDEIKVSDHTIKSLGLDKQNYITMKIGVKPDAAYVGGFNLFGEKFGDYPQNIIMEVYDEIS
ncbi:MAG: transcriptional regulator, TrmB [Herbinix sp.]|nr:transcriptional regulator, TrmB [Herbinix sp.]